MWGVWANFINNIEFGFRNSDKKLKIRLSEEDKTVSSRNLKIRYFEVFFSDRKIGQIKLFLECLKNSFLNRQ